MDQAGWPVSDKVQVPSHVRLLFQPAYSPELQPAEHLWPLLDEPKVHRHFPSLDDLETTEIQQCQRLRTQRDRIRSATLFPWWPRIG